MRSLSKSVAAGIWAGACSSLILSVSCWADQIHASHESEASCFSQPELPLSLPADVAILDDQLAKALDASGFIFTNIPRCEDPEAMKTLEDVVDFIIHESIYYLPYTVPIKKVLDNAEPMEVPKNGLNRLEQALLYFYKGSSYRIVNSALREGGSLQRCYQPLIDAIVAALEKLPRYSGVVYRKAEYSRLIEDHPLGATVVYPAFTSTTIAKVGVSVFSDPNFTVLSDSCRDFRQINPSEQEILCPPGTAFHVVAQPGPRQFVLVEKGVKRKRAQELLSAAGAHIKVWPEAPQQADSN